MAVRRGSSGPRVLGRPQSGMTSAIALIEASQPAWYGDAVCAETSPEDFFPEKGGSTRMAKKICSGCPVWRECLEWALVTDQRHGIWGGMSERERRVVMRRRREALELREEGAA